MNLGDDKGLDCVMFINGYLYTIGSTVSTIVLKKGIVSLLLSEICTAMISYLSFNASHDTILNMILFIIKA